MFGRIAQASGLGVDEWIRGLAATTLLGRLPALDEVAEYLAFAASDRAASMTGVIANLSAGAGRLSGRSDQGPYVARGAV